MTTAITNDFVVRSGLIVQGTTAVTSSTGQAGALQVDGGLAVAKNVFVGTNVAVGGQASLNTLVVSGAATLTTVTITGGVDFQSGISTTGTLFVAGTSTFGSDVFANQGVRVLGQLTVTQATNLLDGLTVANNFTANGQSTFNAQVFVTGTNGLTVGAGLVDLGGKLNVAGDALISTSTTAAIAGGGSGALKVVGGAYIGDNLIVNSTAWDTGTNTANALYVKGGAWIDESLVVDGPTTFNDIVVFNGTATYVFSTNTVYTDNLLNLHTPPGGVNTPWTFDDGKDIGLIIHYYKGADKTGFLGFANDSSYLEWYEDGTESGGVFTGTTYGTFKTGDIKLVGTGNASNTVTGALQVAGGVGIGLDFYAGGTVNAATLIGRGLAQDRLVLVGASGNLTDDSDLTWNSSLNQIEGRIAFANTATEAGLATNLAGGTSGAIPYQNAANSTTFVTIGANGYVLQSNGTAPFWGPVSGITAGNANTATNIDNGAKDQIPYQTGFGQTTFSPNLTFNGTTFTTTNVAVSGIDDTQNTSNSGALQVAGGASITKSLWVGNSATIAGNLYVDGDIFLQGSGLNTLNAQTGTFEYVVVTGTTGTGLTVNADASIGRNLNVVGVATISNVLATGITVTHLTATNANVSNLTLGSGLTVVDFTATTITVTGQSSLQNVTAAITTVTTLTVTGNETVSGNLAVTGVSTFTGKVLVNDTTNSLASNNGSIVTLGGIGVAQDIVMGGSLTVGPTTTNAVVPAMLSNSLFLASYTSGSISTTSTQSLDSFSAAVFRTARYTIQIVDGTSVHVTEMTIFHDGTDVYLNEYGISTSDGQLGTFDADMLAGTVTLKFTPFAATAMTIKVIRWGITL